MLQTILEPNARISEQELKSLERQYGIALPKSYEEFLLKTNGGQPVPPAFPITGLADNPIGVVQAFFGLKAAISTEDLERILEEHAHLVPKGILPIACTGGADFLVIDLRKPSAPVLFWDRRPFWGTDVWNEADLYPVADDFESLLASLHENPYDQPPYDQP
jgi:hypothetical protein